jgi:glycerophosphoryl diester phosphodiesterase
VTGPGTETRGFFAPGPQPAAGRPRIVAHRGFSAVAPENTLAALRAALRSRADGVEFDVQCSRDGHLVLLHDDTLDRTTDGTGPAGARELRELRALDAGSWFSPDFRGEAIPTLGEALDLLAPAGCVIFCELKGPAPPEVVDEACGMVRRRGLQGVTRMISLDWKALERVRHHHPGIAVGVVVEHSRDLEEGLRLAAARRGDLLDPDYRLLLARPDVAQAARERGVAMAAWTVNDLESAAAAWGLGVGDLTTDQVDRLLDWSLEQG